MKGNIISILILTILIVSIGKYNLDEKKLKNNTDITYHEPRKSTFEENFSNFKIINIHSKEIKTKKSGTWIKIWEDTFDHPTLSSYKWNFVNKGNNYNNELQYYKNENIQIKDGILHLIGKKESYKNHLFTSGKITTLQKKHFKNNRIEIRARYPAGQGLFPAIWLLPTDQDKTLPEIDIFEVIGSDPATVYMVNHFSTTKKTQSNSKTYYLPAYSTFHTYVVEWDENEIRWYVDDELIFTSTNGMPDEPMYLLINLAIGGNWPGNPNSLTPFPSSFDIDYVKVYAKKGG